jgi:hypothetical protein
MRPMGAGGRRRRRRNPGFDPVPWVIGGMVAWAGYELFQLITTPSGGGGGSPVTDAQLQAAMNGAGPALTPAQINSLTPAQLAVTGGGGASF